MADVKISALPLASTPLAGTEVLPIVQSATTDQVSIANLTAGRAVSAASLTLTTTPLAAGSGGTGLTSLGTGVATTLGNAINGASGFCVQDASGNLGVGTASPTNRLHVIQSTASTTCSIIRGVSGAQTIIDFNGGGSTYYDATSHNFRTIAGAATLTIDPGNNVGIGATSITSRLTVQATNNYSDIYGLIQAYNSGTSSSDSASVTVKSYSGTSQFMQWQNIGLRFGSRITTNSGAGNLIFTYGNDSEGMRLDSSGNLGLGVTPSAWLSSLRAMQVLSASIVSSNATTVFGSNVYYDSAATTRYITSNFAGSIVYNPVGNGGWAFNIATLGIAGNAISFTQAMTLDASGNLLVGTTSGGVSFGGKNISMPNASAFTIANASNVSSGTAGAAITYFTNNQLYIDAADSTSQINFRVNGQNVRMVINGSGVVTIPGLAGSGSRAVNADANGSLSAASDMSLKSEVVTAPLPGLNEIIQLQPRAYQWLSEIERIGDDAAVEVGFFANEVASIIPSAAPKGVDGLYGFYDRSVTAALVNAVKELAAEVAELKAKVA
jgi:hypothetical protein